MGNVFTSITASKNSTARCTVSESDSQSISCAWMKRERLMLPRLQLSQGRRGCSPEGFVACISPSPGTVLFSLMRSRKSAPGSPHFHAESDSEFHRSRGSMSQETDPSLGLTRSYLCPFSRDEKNARSKPTERLKFWSPPVSFARMNPMISGWLLASTPMFAPLRFPPCMSAFVASSKTRIKERGPLATPAAPCTTSPRGLICENEKPVPPPLLWRRAMRPSTEKICLIESSTGSTKHAES